MLTCAGNAVVMFAAVRCVVAERCCQLEPEARGTGLQFTQAEVRGSGVVLISVWYLVND